MTKKVGLRAEFSNGTEGGPAWIGTYTTDLEAGAEKEVKQLSSLTLKQIDKSGLLGKR